MKTFFDKSWWQNALGSTFGTIVGIVLTFGITFWMQQREQVRMARKITKITLRNLDIRIGFMQQEIETLKAKDSLFRSVYSHYPDRLATLGEDTLQRFAESMEQRIYTMTDRKSENIFSSSFEVWQYLDDEKIIGRISNCYSIIDYHNRLTDELHQRLAEAWHAGWATLPASYARTPAAVARFLLERHDVRQAMELVAPTARLLEQTATVARRLNERNKQVMGVTDEELDEIGNLLEQNNYEING